MSIRVQDSKNQPLIQQRVDSLNQKNSSTCSLDDYKKQLKTLNNIQITSFVTGILGAGFAFSANPIPTLIGGVIGCALQIASGSIHSFGSAPHFAIVNGKIVQVNEELTKKLNDWKDRKLAIITTDSLTTGIAVMDVFNVGPAKWSDFPREFSVFSSFYLGMRGISSIRGFINQFI
jgi:hypothetical protein